MLLVNNSPTFVSTTCRSCLNVIIGRNIMWLWWRVSKMTAESRKKKKGRGGELNLGMKVVARKLWNTVKTRFLLKIQQYYLQRLQQYCHNCGMWGCERDVNIKGFLLKIPLGPIRRILKSHLTWNNEKKQFT